MLIFANNIVLLSHIKDLNSTRTSLFFIEIYSIKTVHFYMRSLFSSPLSISVNSCRYFRPIFEHLWIQYTSCAVCTLLCNQFLSDIDSKVFSPSLSTGLNPETLIKRQATQHGCLPSMNCCTGMKKAEQKSLVPAGQVQLTNQWRTPVNCTLLVPIHLSLNSLQGPPTPL